MLLRCVQVQRLQSPAALALEDIRKLVYLNSVRNIERNLGMLC